ncbi:MAG: gliding motility-associated ABC transporter ATP-binding subunit GldA [Verrucomicrobia bacterium]|nr:gliding motility-associated ABC transporter ATP-binding subunit GldA [Cytophagales bacterium]
MSVVVSGLTKVYGSQKAVDAISFTAQQGEILGFLGPNGAGKSTTMKIITGYLPPSAGKAEVLGFDVERNAMQVRRNIGYLPEHNPLYVDMYVHEYLHFIGSLHQLKGKRLKEKTAEIIEKVGLTVEQNKKIGALSKGYRQRVGLASTLLHDPQVLILDEPTTGLDPNQIIEIRNLIKNLGKEKTIIFSSHLMQEVEAICNRVLIINHGKLVADNKVTDLQQLHDRQITVLVEFASQIDVNILNQLADIEQVEKISENQYAITAKGNTDLRASIFKLAAENQWTLVGLRQEESSLENVFQKLTKNT